MKISGAPSSPALVQPPTHLTAPLVRLSLKGWPTTIVDGGGVPTRILTAAVSATAAVAACDCFPDRFSERVPATTQQFWLGMCCFDPVQSAQFRVRCDGFALGSVAGYNCSGYKEEVVRFCFGFSQQQSTLSTKVNRSTAGQRPIRDLVKKILNDAKLYYYCL
ncbi:hypothetical protein Hanom_Chr09g00775981 [Helianthus anomalus]